MAYCDTATPKRRERNMRNKKDREQRKYNFSFALKGPKIVDITTAPLRRKTSQLPKDPTQTMKLLILAARSRALKKIK